MVRFANSPVNRRQAHTVVKFLDELAVGLPHPSARWRWGYVELSHECLYNLKTTGLIEPVQDAGQGREWRATVAAWRDVRDRSDDRQMRVTAYVLVA